MYLLPRRLRREQEVLDSLFLAKHPLLGKGGERYVVNEMFPATPLTGETSRYLSSSVWGGMRIAELIANPDQGIFRFDDFRDLPLAPTLTTQIAFGKYKAFANTGCTLSRVSAVNSVELAGGVLQQAIDTDDDGVSIADAYPSFMMSGLSSNSKKLAFECCYTQNSVATNMAAVFIGLAETEQWTLANGVPFNAGDAITNSASAIGFRIEEDGLGVIDTVYSDRATSFTNIENDTDATSGTGDLAANTFKKFGMLYDPEHRDLTRIVRFFVDGIELQTALPKTTLTGLTNLDENALGLLWASCADSAGTSFKGYMKWWAVAQWF